VGRGLSWQECLGGFGAASGWLKVDVGLTQVGIGGVAAVAGSCLAELGAEALTGVQIFSLCPKKPSCDADAAGLSPDDIVGPIVDGITGTTSGMSAGSGSPSNPPVSFFAKKGKRGNADDCEGRDNKQHCETAKKLLKQAPRLARDRGLSPQKVDELARKVADGTISWIDLPPTIRSKFPGEYQGYSLKELEKIC
jgi:hypothetical protein